jgi:hypothetical protein
LAPLVVANLFGSSARFPDVPEVPNTMTKVANNTIKLNELAAPLLARLHRSIYTQTILNRP